MRGTHGIWSTVSPRITDNRFSRWLIDDIDYPQRVVVALLAVSWFFSHHFHDDRIWTRSTADATLGNVSVLVASTQIDLIAALTELEIKLIRQQGGNF
jgi:protein-S-isoprenylcysteine O-methyltransferase Ste14